MKNRALIIPALGFLLFACDGSTGDKLSFEPGALSGTWSCQFGENTGVIVNSLTTYNIDGSLDGSADIIVDLIDENTDALLKVFSKGSWELDGNKLTEYVDDYTFKPQNDLGLSILSDIESEFKNIDKASFSEIISLSQSQITFKLESGSVETCSRKN